MIMSNTKIQFTEFTESLASMIEYNKHFENTNFKEYKRLLNILSKAIIGELTDRQRECITMRYYQKLSVTEIAIKLNIGKSTVSRHIKKARIRLQKILDYYIESNINFKNRNY